MYTIEDRVLTDTNDLVVMIEENFYFMDVEFDSTNCKIIFNEIGQLFIEKNELDKFKKECLFFIRECLREVDKNSINDYTLFLDNIYILLETNLFNVKDIEKLKNNIISKIDLEEKEPKIGIS